MATSVSSPADGEGNLSVERGGFERNRVNNQTPATSKLLFLPPVCARKLHVLFMSRSYRVFTVSAIYGRSSFTSYYRWHLHPIPLQHPASDARYTFAASRRTRPSLNLILTDERSRVQRWSIRRQMARKTRYTLPPSCHFSETSSLSLFLFLSPFSVHAMHPTTFLNIGLQIRFPLGPNILRITVVRVLYRLFSSCNLTSWCQIIYTRIIFGHFYFRRNFYVPSRFRIWKKWSII